MTLDDLRQIALLLAQGNSRITFEGAEQGKGDQLVKLDGDIVGRDLMIYTSVFAPVKGAGIALTDFYLEVVLSVMKYLPATIQSQVKAKLLEIGAIVFDQDSLTMWQEILS